MLLYKESDYTDRDTNKRILIGVVHIWFKIITYIYTSETITLDDKAYFSKLIFPLDYSPYLSTQGIHNMI